MRRSDRGEVVDLGGLEPDNGRPGVLARIGLVALGLILVGGALLLARRADTEVPPASPQGSPFTVLENRCPDPLGPARLPWGGGMPAYSGTFEQQPFRTVATFEDAPDAEGRRPSLELAVQQFAYGLPVSAEQLRTVGGRHVTIYFLPALSVQAEARPGHELSPLEGRAWWREGDGPCQIVTLALRDDRTARTTDEVERALLDVIKSLPVVAPAPAAWTFSAFPDFGDRIGPIRLGMSTSEVLAALGEPDTRSAEGLATWHWQQSGGTIRVIFDATSSDPSGLVRSIWVNETTLETAEGFANGMNSDEFARIYFEFPIVRQIQGRWSRLAIHARGLTAGAIFDGGGNAVVVEVTLSD